VKPRRRWIVTTLHEEDPCIGCGSSCTDPPEPTSEESPLGARSLVLGSVGFFLGPVLLAIAAAALFDDGGPLQLAATAGALVGGMAVAWLVGRLFGFSRKDTR
jgi:hypothetical protein